MSYRPRLVMCFVLLLMGSAVSAETERTVTVNGTGVVSVAPDLARVQLAVVERSPTVANAQAAKKAAAPQS